VSEDTDTASELDDMPRGVRTRCPGIGAAPQRHAPSVVTDTQQSAIADTQRSATTLFLSAATRDTGGRRPPGHRRRLRARIVRDNASRARPGWIEAACSASSSDGRSAVPRTMRTRRLRGLARRPVAANVVIRHTVEFAIDRGGRSADPSFVCLEAEHQCRLDDLHRRLCVDESLNRPRTLPRRRSRWP